MDTHNTQSDVQSKLHRQKPFRDVADNIPEKTAFNSTSSQEAAWLLRDKYAGVECDDYRADLKRLAADEPLAYVIGWVPFLGLRIALDSHPLIPRPETEWWTEKLIKTLTKEYGTESFRVLDLCAGSGAIGCAILAACPRANVTFVEIESVHKKTILNNLTTNGISANRARVHIGDLFTPIYGEHFDIIATNPPYIPEKRKLPPSVSNFEPTVALRAGDDGLALIRIIARELRKHLSSGGSAWIEIDSAYAKEALTIFTNSDMRAELHTDPYGNLRLVVAH